MKQRILNHASILVVVSVLVTFIAASSVLYERYAANMKQGVRDEAKYVQIGIDEYGEQYLLESVSEYRILSPVPFFCACSISGRSP